MPTPAADTRRIEVFRPGQFRAMSGAEFSFSAADVSRIAEVYDPDKAPAPIVVGHPSHDDPAFGWAKGFEVNDDGVLVAEIGDLAPEFVDAVTQGRYRKISMKFFPPDAPNNPVPGSYYPRHIGFLGGAAPAVSGLKPVQFADDGADLIEIEFGDPSAREAAGLFRKMREFIIEKFGREAADGALPEWQINWLDDLSRSGEEATTAFAAPTPKNKETEMPGTAAAQALAARETQVAEREAALAHAENLAFAEKLVEEDKLLPTLAPRVVAVLDHLARRDGAVEIEFADGSSRVKENPHVTMKALLEAMPKVIQTGAADLGETVDLLNDAEQIAAFAEAYQKERSDAGVTVSISDAVMHVMKKGGAK